MAITESTARALGNDLTHVFKRMSAVKHHLPRTHTDVEISAFPLLHAVACRPQRISALAGHVHSDTSTVSRQISQLAQHGLVEKVPDPDDGRAQVVRITAEGKDLLESMATTRGRLLRGVLRDWTEQDASRFSTYLQRFAADISQELDRLNGASQNGKDHQ